MLLLVNGSTKTVRRLAPGNRFLGCLMTPGNWNTVKSTVATGLPWAIDNGAFSGFDPDAFRKLCRAAQQAEARPLWVVVPDVVADAIRTIKRFREWIFAKEIQGLPLAFVAQDGQEHQQVPWATISCLFIGGSTEWKLGIHAEKLAAEAKRRGKWVHMGRVNSLRRMRHAYEIGCDSVDGSSMSRFGDTYIHKFCRWSARLQQQGSLFGFPRELPMATGC